MKKMLEERLSLISTKMVKKQEEVTRRKDINKEIEIPEGFEINVSGRSISLKGNGKEIEKDFDTHNLEIKKEGSLLKITSKNPTRRESKMAGTIEARLKNMIKGLQEDFVYKMEICNAHFPMNVKVDDAKKEVVIKSFLGETIERKAKILGDVKVNVKGTDIEISSYDIDDAGQTAANIEKATKLKGRDRRIYQDGIFITEKPGRII